MYYSSERALDPLTLEIYPGADRALTLYEDDGESTAYQNGEFAETRFETHRGDGEFLFHLSETSGRLAGDLPARTMVLNVHRQPQVASVTCDAETIGALSSAEEWTQARSGWHWDPQTRLLSVKLAPAKRSRTVRIQ
jgi:Domain of unknown function (DUF5110)